MDYAIITKSRTATTWPLLCSTFTSSILYGLLFMLAANMLLLARIRMEEDMLIGAFGDEHRVYRKMTKRLIPFIY